MDDHSAASIVESNKYTQQSFDSLVMLYFRMCGEVVEKIKRNFINTVPIYMSNIW